MRRRPRIAHHVVQGDHFTTVAVCEPCHVGKGGIHGDQTMLRLRYRIGGITGELRAINETLRRVEEGAGVADMFEPPSNARINPNREAVSD